MKSKRSMNKLFNLMLVFALVAFTSSCNKDEAVPDGPTITYPSAGIQTAVVGVAKDFIFTANFPGGYKAHTLTVFNGAGLETGAIPTEGSAQVTFTISFTGSSEGTAAITLSVTDRNNKSAENTMVIDVTL